MSVSPSQAAARRDGLALAVAVLGFGLAGVLGKMTGLAAPLIVLGRVVLAGSALAGLAGARRWSVRPRSRRDLVVLVTQGVLLAIHWTSFFQAINVSNVAIGLLAYSSFPLFTALIEPVALRQPRSWQQVTAALLILPGLAVMTPTVSLGNRVTAGIAWGLLSAASFAVLSVTNRWLGRRYSSAVISLYQDGTAALVLLPTLFFVPLAPLLSARVLLLLLVLGLVCTALAHTLYIASMRTFSAQTASLFAATEPLWGILFALALLGEMPSGRTIAGGAIILCAALLASCAMVRRAAQRQARRYASDPLAPSPDGESVGVQSPPPSWPA